MKGVRLGLLISVSERYALAIVALASSILVARILTPEEIGIYSVSLAVVAVAQVLRDFGIGSFLVQAKELTDAYVRTAFGISLVIGASLFAIVWALAPFAARFYNEPALLETLFLSSLNFLILPFCSISMAILRREMRFKRIAAVNLIAAIASAITIVYAAYLGAGPNSMAIGSVVLSLVTGLGTWFARSNRRFLMPAFTEWRALLSYGGQATAASAVTSIAVSSNDLVLGKVLGFGPVAIISRAQGLMNLFHRDFMTAIRNVAFPAFATAHREGQALEEKYIASVTSITAIAWPFYGMLALFPLEIMRLMFGPQWDTAANLVPIFAMAGAVSASVNLVQPLLIASGRIDLASKAEFIVQPIRFVLIAVTAIVFENITACAIAYLLVTILTTPVFYWFKHRAIATDFRHLAQGLARSALVSICTLAAPAIYSFSAGFGRSEPEPISLFVTTAIITALVWLVALQSLGHPLSKDPAFLRIRSRIKRPF
ncbi:MAG: lipopolysaccharide biosynthesis protein [Azoarcus sp.]|nr:lipopolysaccharide biosynthesis protein [Azoarcus sp.]